MKKIISLALVLALALTATAQKEKSTNPKGGKETVVKDTTAPKPKPTPAKAEKKESATQTVTVEIPNKVFTEIAFTADTAIVPFIPEQVVVVFPDNDPTKYTLQVNKTGDENKFTLSLKCPADDTTCIPIQLSDIVNGKLTLKTHKGALLYTDADKNIISKTISGTKLYLKINTLAAAKKEEKKNPYDICGLTENTEQKEIPLTGTNPTPQINPRKFYCSCVNCKCDTCKTSTHKDSCKVTASPSPFNQLYLAPCLDKNGNALSHTYEVIYDTRKGSTSPITYLKIQKTPGKNGEFKKVIKENAFNPERGAGVVVRVIGSDTVQYSVEWEGEQLYIDQQTDFADAIQKAIAGIASPDSAGTPTPPENEGSGNGNEPAKGEASPKNLPEQLAETTKLAKEAIQTSAANANQIKENKEDIENLELLSKTYAHEITLLQKESNRLKLLIPTQNILPVNDTLTQKEKIQIKKQIADLEVRTQKLEDAAAITNAQIAKLQQADTLLAQQDSILQKQIDSIRIQITKMDSTIKAGITSATVSTASFKANLLSLHEALTLFNRNYPSIDTRAKEYADDLVCIKKSIADSFYITVSGSADDLQKSLNNKVVLLNIDKKFYLELCNLIKGIVAEYRLAVGKKKTYSITSQHLTIPNDDIVNVRFKAADKYIGEKLEWYVKGGFKIDFSGGIYVNGITDFDVFYRDVSIRYKMDSTIVDSTTGNTSQVYFGTNDTTGRVVSYNQKRVPDIGTGLFMHFYSRVNKVVGLGGGFGITTNFVSTFRILLGGSILLSTGRNGRIALTGGLALGNQVVLDKSVKGYSVEELNKKESQLQNSVYDLPKFTTSTDKIQTTTSVGYSWFAGFSYNFATVSPAKKK